MDHKYICLFGEATESEGLWSRGSRQGTLSPAANPQRHGGKSSERERRPQTTPPSSSGKAGVANEQQL